MAEGKLKTWARIKYHEFNLMKGLTQMGDYKDATKHIEALAEIGTPHAIDTIIKNGFKSVFGVPRHIAMDVLMNANNPHSLDLLISNLKTAHNTDVQLECLRALGKIGNRKAVEAIVNHGLAHYDTDISITAVWTLERLGSKIAVKPLIQHGLNNATPMKLREATVNALGELGDKKALPHLMKMTGKNKFLNSTVKTAIQKIQEANDGKR